VLCNSSQSSYTTLGAVLQVNDLYLKSNVLDAGIVVIE